MQIKDLDTKTGWITLEMKDTELRAITNLLFRARSMGVNFDEKDYEIYSNLYTAITILHCGYLPNFELNYINELRELSYETMKDNTEMKGEK